MVIGLPIVGLGGALGSAIGGDGVEPDPIGGVNLIFLDEAHELFQGRGIGSALMSACFDDAERRNATISIVKSVLGAEEFYGRHGFLIVGPGSTTKRDVIIPDTRMARASSRLVD